MNGIEPLRAAIAAKMASFNGLPVNRETEVLVTSGTTGGMHAACMALLNPGDEVIVLEPFYGYHLHTLMSMRAKPVVVSLEAPDWTLDASRNAARPLRRAHERLSSTRRGTHRARFFHGQSWSRSRRSPLQHDLFVLHRRDLRVLPL